MEQSFTVCIFDLHLSRKSRFCEFEEIIISQRQRRHGEFEKSFASWRYVAFRFCCSVSILPKPSVKALHVSSLPWPYAIYHPQLLTQPKQQTPTSFQRNKLFRFTLPQNLASSCCFTQCAFGGFPGPNIPRATFQRNVFFVVGGRELTGIRRRLTRSSRSRGGDGNCGGSGGGGNDKTWGGGWIVNWKGRE